MKHLFKLRARRHYRSVNIRCARLYREVTEIPSIFSFRTYYENLDELINGKIYYDHEI